MRGHARNEATRTSCTYRCKGQQVLVPPIHRHSKEIEAAVIETEVSSHPIERFPGSNHVRRRSVSQHSTDPLHGTAIKVKGAQVQIGMIVGTGRSSSLNFIASCGIAFQVEAVRKSCVQILEVGIGEYADCG